MESTTYTAIVQAPLLPQLIAEVSLRIAAIESECQHLKDLLRLLDLREPTTEEEEKA